MCSLALISQVWYCLALDTLGLLAGVGAALCAAVYFLLGEHLVQDTPLTVITWGIVIGVLSFLLGVSSLQYLPVTVASVLALADPIVATGLAWALLGELLTVTQLAGGVVLLAGAVTVQWYSPGKQPYEPLPPLGETGQSPFTAMRPKAERVIPLTGADPRSDHTSTAEKK